MTPAASLPLIAALLVSACASGGCEHEWIVRSRCEVQHKPMPAPAFPQSETPEPRS